MNFVPTWTDDMQATLERMAGEAAPVRQIAAALGVSRNAVIGRARRTKVSLLYRQPPARPRVRSASPRPRSGGRRPTKLTAAAREDLRQRYLDGESYDALCERFGVSRGSIPYYTKGLPRRVERASGNRYDHAFKVMVVAAQLCGESYDKLARRLGPTHRSVHVWKNNPAIRTDAEALAERIKAQAAAREAEERRLREAEAEAERVRIAAHNEPILAAMPLRHRNMMASRIAGQTLEEIGQAFGVSRERIRQIEAKWRLQGLIVPGAKPLNVEAARRIGKPRGRPPKSPPPVRDEAYWQAKVEAAYEPFDGVPA